jgi:hypothetical protein
MSTTEWEIVVRDVTRLEVPGGWIYVIAGTTESSDGSAVFVPHVATTERSLTAIADELADIAHLLKEKLP